MDWNLIFTAVGQFVAIAVAVIAFVQRARAKELDDMNEKFQSVDKRIDGVNREVSDKAHKDEVRRIEDRFEKDIADLRNDQKTGFAEIRNDIKDMRTDLMDAIRTAVNDRRIIK